MMVVLDRPARGKDMPSEQQRVEWQWFKPQWDEAMSNELNDDWPLTFAGWMQQVANDTAAGNRAALSQFVHNETRRKFNGHRALVAPASAAAGRSCGPSRAAE